MELRFQSERLANEWGGFYFTDADDDDDDGNVVFSASYFSNQCECVFARCLFCCLCSARKAKSNKQPLENINISKIDVLHHFTGKFCMVALKLESMRVNSSALFVQLENVLCAVCVYLCHRNVSKHWFIRIIKKGQQEYQYNISLIVARLRFMNRVSFISISLCQ